MEGGPPYTCPSCKAPLAQWSCGTCGVTYPLVDGIPWLLPSPGASLGEWRARLTHLTQRLDGEAEALKVELKQTGLRELTQKRLRKLLQAKVEHRKLLIELLAPLELAVAGSEDMSQAFKIRIPASQSLTAYYGNIHRDWAWDTQENQASLDAVLGVLAPDDLAGGAQLLVLGAGAGRLAYDLHLARKPARTVVTDINPLMLLAAKRLFKGKTVKLFEFPLAPLDLDQQAVLRKCAAPAGPATGLDLVFADALHPPFGAGTFDVVLTPWLLDILPPSLEALAAAISSVLKPGGIWLNFGTLAFNHSSQGQNFSLEEVVELVTASGFSVGEMKRQRIPYMQSPASGHGRLEMVTTFAARKVREAVATPPAPPLPAWLTDDGVAIPKLRAFEAFVAVHTILLETVSLIDGKRSLKELAAIFAARHGLKPAEAEASVRNFLLRHHEETSVGRAF